jgi:hypothetical protein
MVVPGPAVPLNPLIPTWRSPFHPAGGWNFFIYLNSRGYYIMPLLVCFLFFCSRVAVNPHCDAPLEQGGQ